MKPPKILYFSDLHLDAKTDGHLRLSELEEVLDYCSGLIKTEKVDIVVFGGDACDPDGPYAIKCIATMADFAHDVCLARGGRINSYWLAGNHDICEDGFGSTVLDPLRAMPGSHVITVPGVHHLGGNGPNPYDIGFLPYPSRLTSYDPAKEVEMWCRNNQIPDIIFGHLSIPGITPGSESQEMARGREHCWPAKEIKQLFPDAICFGGHYHKGDNYWLDGLPIQVVGAPARFTHGEEENKPRVAIIEGKTCRYVAIPNTRQLRTVSLGALSKDWPEQFGKDAIVRLRHGPGATIDQLSAAQTQLLKMGAVIVKTELAEHEAAAPAAQVTAEDGFAIAEQLARDIRTGEAALDQAIVELTKAVAGDAQ